MLRKKHTELKNYSDYDLLRIFETHTRSEFNRAYGLEVGKEFRPLFVLDAALSHADVCAHYGNMRAKEFGDATSDFVTDMGWVRIFVSLGKCHSRGAGGPLTQKLFEESEAGQRVYVAMTPLLDASRAQFSEFLRLMRLVARQRLHATVHVENKTVLKHPVAFRIFKAIGQTAFYVAVVGLIFTWLNIAIAPAVAGASAHFAYGAGVTSLLSMVPLLVSAEQEVLQEHVTGVQLPSEWKYVLRQDYALLMRDMSQMLVDAGVVEDDGHAVLFASQPTSRETVSVSSSMPVQPVVDTTYTPIVHAYPAHVYHPLYNPVVSTGLSFPSYNHTTVITRPPRRRIIRKDPVGFNADQ